MSTAAAIADAQRLAKEGRFAEAEQRLRQALQTAPGDAALRGNLAQLLASMGQRDAAIAELETLVAEAPSLRPARLMLARLANERGRFDLAETHAEFLTRADVRDAEACAALGFSVFSQGRRREARTMLERAVALKPGYAVAQRNLAAVLCEQEESEAALSVLQDAERHGGMTAGLLRTRAQALMQLERVDEADEILAALVKQQPDDIATHRVLAQLRQLRGDEDPLSVLRASARRAGAPPALRMALADALRRTGDLAASEQELRALLASQGKLPELETSLATVLQERGDFAQSLAPARAALDAMPDDVAIAETFVVAHIATGSPAQALPVVERFRLRQPRDQRWITHRIDIARLRGESELESWFDPARVTRSYDLPAPAGFSSREGFLASLAAALDARHRHRRHPLDQSLRQGTQTSRNLLVRPDPVVSQLLDVFAGAVREFVHDMGASLPAEHPLNARRAGEPVLVGCWSVRLNRGGYHVNHIHPEGWVSSAFYVRVPGEAADTQKRAGWLTFGEPRFPIPGLPSTGQVQPTPGKLVLFPSYLWHGTTSLAGDEPRLSVAFDAVPAVEIR